MGKVLKTRDVVMLTAAVAAVALPSMAFAVDRIYTGGTATNGTNWFTLTNWSPSGTYAGVVTPGAGTTAPAGGGAANDVVFTGSFLATSGFGVNFGGQAVASAINGGTLTLGALVHNTSSLTGASTTTLQFGNTGTVGLIVAGAGTLSITGTVAFTGGTVNVGSTGGTLNHIVGAITDSATTNISLTSQSVNAATFSNTTLTYQINNTDSGFYVPVGRTFRLIPNMSEGTASSGLVKYGAGTLELGTQVNSLQYTNTYTGTTTLNQGLLIIDNGAGTLGTGPVVLNGGELRGNYNSFDFDATRPFTINGNPTINNNGFTGYIRGVVGGSGTLNKTGSATVFLTGSGTLFVGTFNVGPAASLGFKEAGSFGPAGNKVVLSSANSQLTLDSVVGNGSIIPAGIALQVNDNSNRINVVGPSETWTFSGPISGPGGVTKVGSGSLTLAASGVLSYTGTTTVNLGNLYVNGVLTSTAGTTVNIDSQLAGAGASTATSPSTAARSPAASSATPSLISPLPGTSRSISRPRASSKVIFPPPPARMTISPSAARSI